MSNTAEDVETAKRAVESKPDDKLTREQRRARERINKEVSDIIDRLVSQWYEVFMNNDPASDVVREKAEEVSAKWKMYCRRRGLKPQALDIVSKSIADLMEEYKKEKAAK